MPSKFHKILKKIDHLKQHWIAIPVEIIHGDYDKTPNGTSAFQKLANGYYA